MGAWARYLSATCGLWLMASPDVLGYGDPARMNDRIVGPIIVALSVIAISGVTRTLRLAVIPLGIWLLIAPIVLGYDTTPLVNSIVTGLVVIPLSLVHGAVNNRFGGGWASLLPGREIDDA